MLAAQDALSDSKTEGELNKAFDQFIAASQDIFSNTNVSGEDSQKTAIASSQISTLLNGIISSLGITGLESGQKSGAVEAQGEIEKIKSRIVDADEVYAGIQENLKKVGGIIETSVVDNFTTLGELIPEFAESVSTQFETLSKRTEELSGILNEGNTFIKTELDALSSSMNQGSVIFDEFNNGLKVNSTKMNTDISSFIDELAKKVFDLSDAITLNKERADGQDTGNVTVGEPSG